MAGFMGSIWRKIRGGNKPNLVTRPGLRGAALGSLAHPDLEFHRQRIAEGKESIPPEEINDFVFGGQPLFVTSTNVAMAQYHHEENKMMVEYKNGASYLYSNVTEDEAKRFAYALSKGVFLWDEFRVRGSRTLHKKPFIRLTHGLTPPKTLQGQQNRANEFNEEWEEALENLIDEEENNG